MPRRAVIKLYIDPRSYQQEVGERLTKARLHEIGLLVNEDAAPIYGYESWSCGFEEVAVPIHEQSRPLIFSQPTTLRVTASLDEILDSDLDEFQGEHIDFVRDVIAVAWTPDNVIITTCRTFDRPDRPVYEIPRKSISAIEARR